MFALFNVQQIPVAGSEHTDFTRQPELFMKTLKYAWLGLFIIIIIAVVALKKFPELVSYDYYYKHLNIYINITPETADEKKSEELGDAIVSLIKKDIKYQLNESFDKAPKKTVEKDSIALTVNLKFKNYHDCYMYLLHHRSSDMKIIPESEVTKSSFVRKTKLTYVKQTGTYENKEEKQKGAVEVSAVCRF